MIHFKTLFLSLLHTKITVGSTIVNNLFETEMPTFYTHSGLRKDIFLQLLGVTNLTQDTFPPQAQRKPPLRLYVLKIIQPLSCTERGQTREVTNIYGSSSFTLFHSFHCL